MAARIDLKPCPICGNPMPHERTEGDAALIVCMNYDHIVTTKGKTLEAAAERWNRREEIE